MNKKLIALAIASACVAPAAMAQTTGGPVTLYGRVYEELVSVEGKASDGAAQIPRRTRIDDESSLLGVRGVEELGGGLKAWFQLETGFHPDQNDLAGAASSWATRNSGVGLQGGWGTFGFGRWDTPYKSATYPVDVFGDLTFAGISSLGHDQGNFDRRDQNQILYWSPTMAGFAFKGMVQVTEAKTATTNPHDTSLLVTWTGGPAYVYLAWEEHKDPNATVSKENGTEVGGYFNLGPVKLGGGYEEIKRQAITGANPADRKEWYANITYTLGANQFIYQHQDSKGGLVNSATLPQAKCDSDTIAYKYIFSKRTFVMLEYMATKNNVRANCSFATTATFPIANGNDVNAFGFAIQHVF